MEVDVEDDDERDPDPVSADDPIEQARRTLLYGLPSATAALVEVAGKGNATHIKLLLQAMGLEKGGLKSQEKSGTRQSLKEFVLEQWAKTP